jgi:hypothetical protein
VTAEQAARFHLQLAPSLTVTPDLKRTVEEAFDDAGVAFEWLAMRGDLTLADAERLGGIERIAQPSLDVLVSAEEVSHPADLVHSVRKQLQVALGRIRQDAHQLPIGVRALTAGRSCRFTFRPSASPESIAEGLEKVSSADDQSGVVGWDDEHTGWVPL